MDDFNAAVRTSSEDMRMYPKTVVIWKRAVWVYKLSADS